MLAYLDANNNPQPWSGQPVNGVSYPLDIDGNPNWTIQQLNQAGLYPVNVFSVPAGDQITGAATYTLNADGQHVDQTYPVAVSATATQLLPQAADDSHAAGLTPPVPVGGLYCNGSQVMQRQS